jgi:hypothetical protein
VQLNELKTDNAKLMQEIKNLKSAPQAACAPASVAPLALAVMTGSEVEAPRHTPAAEVRFLFSCFQ